MNKVIKNIPNMLTISRIVASVAGATSFIIGNIPLSVILYIYGAVSDCFDGLAARKLNAFSELGRKLDAISDKIYAGSLLIPSIVCGNFLMIMPLLFELKISQINLKSQKMRFKTETQRVGKFKTALLFPTMIVGLLATLNPYMYLLLAILLPTTIVLQTKSIIVYLDLLKNNINNNSINKDEVLDPEIKEHDVSRDKSINKTNNCNNAYNKSVDLAEELAFYIMTPLNYNNGQNDNVSKKPYTKIKKRNN